MSSKKLKLSPTTTTTKEQSSLNVIHGDNGDPSTWTKCSSTLTIVNDRVVIIIIIIVIIVGQEYS
jgi:hypothetical protein